MRYQEISYIFEQLSYNFFSYNLIHTNHAISQTTNVAVTSLHFTMTINANFWFKTEKLCDESQ